MKVDSPRFGPLEVEQDDVIEFPEGLPGFEHCKRFSLFHEAGGQPIVYTLQSLDDPEVALPVADPAQFGFHYELTLEDSDVAMLEVGSADDVAVAVVLRRNGCADDAGAGAISANVMAPLVINTRTRRGKQQPISKLGFDVTFRTL
ncbi:MAG: flagellar assembly protein FliW [Rhodocyclaceae bacterium]